MLGPLVLLFEIALFYLMTPGKKTFYNYLLTVVSNQMTFANKYDMLITTNKKVVAIILGCSYKLTETPTRRKNMSKENKTIELKDEELE